MVHLLNRTFKFKEYSISCMGLSNNKKGQWAHMIARENRSIARENRILFTSYLMEKGYGDPYQIANFWGVSSNTAKTYMKEAQYVKLADTDREKIKAIMDKENCDIPTAIAKQYERLTNTKGCFIATAAYDIDVLRNWRDDSLGTNIIGKNFINFYYKHSPPIADYISNKKMLRWITRMLLKPIIFILSIKYKKMRYSYSNEEKEKIKGILSEEKSTARPRVLRGLND